MAHDQHHSADLAIAAFRKNDAHPCAISLCLQDAQRFEFGRPRFSRSFILQIDSAFKSAHSRIINFSLHGHVIDTRDVMGGMCQQVGEFAVIGK